MDERERSEAKPTRRVRRMRGACLRMLLCAGSLVLLMPVIVWASQANVYIAQTAAGSADGSSCANAKAVSFFNTASNWGTGSTQIGPGTTVHVCGTITGAPGSNILTFQGSGAGGNPITLRFEPGASLSAPYCGQANSGNGCLVVSTDKNPRSNIIIDGGTPCGWDMTTNSSEGPCTGTIVNTANGTNLANKSSTTAITMFSCTNCEVKNLGIYNMYVATAGDTVIGNPTQINSIYFSGSNIAIDHNKIHDSGWSLFDAWNNGNTDHFIYNNESYNVQHAFIHSSGGNTTGSNLHFYNNYFHDYANWDTPGCSGHHDGIHTYGNIGGGSYPVWTGFYVYNNIFGGNVGSCMTSQIYISGNSYDPGTDTSVHNAYVFNNVLTATSPLGTGILCLGAGAGHRAFNNTIVNTGTAADGTCFNWSHISQIGSTMTYKNNAISGCFALLQSNGSDTGITGDYNAFANCSSIGSCFCAFAPGGTSSWTLFRANPYGQEQHSTAALYNTNLCCGGSLGLNGAYAPQAGSMLIGAGTNLTDQATGVLSALSKDINGNPRPSTGPWDIGAYQYAASSILYGDVSENGSVTAYDASLASQYAVGLITLTSIQITKADVSGNSSVSAYDASLIAQYAVGLITKFPVEP